MVMNKKGQVFLIAALIIATLIFSVSRTFNSVKVGKNQGAFYDLTKEIDYETKRVIDYGVVNGVPNVGKISFSFLNNYTDYLKDQEVIYVFGNSSDIFAVHYDLTNKLNAVSLNTGGAPINIPIQTTRGTRASVSKSPTGEIDVLIREIHYKFNLKEGQNFYFVIIKDEDGEKFVAT